MKRYAIILALCGVCFANSYTTSFPATENPVSESGKWVGGQSAGGNLWGDMQTTPGFAFGATEPTQYGDPTAILTGTWGATQDATIVVRIPGARPSGCCFETEVTLRGTIGVKQGDCTNTQCITKYEILCSVSSTVPYLQVVKWLGKNGSFAYLAQNSALSCANGDKLRAKITGGASDTVINVWRNGALVNFDVGSNVKDSAAFVSGTPGMGTYGSALSTFGISNFTATDGVGPLPPTQLKEVTH